jgi:predicted RNA methylase
MSSRRDVIYQPSIRPRDDYDYFLLEEQRWLESATAEVTARYLPVLARALATELARGVRQSITSEALEQVVVALATLRHPPERDPRRSVYDPTCGTASLLIAAAEAAADTPLPVYGQDINPETAAIARAHAFLCDMPQQIAVANTLVEDAFASQRFDLVVADIPFGLSWAQYRDAVVCDPRYPAGYPAQNDATLLLVQAAVSKLRQPQDGGGRAVLFCTPAPLVDRAGSLIREWLVGQDLIEGIVALPEGLSAVSNLRLYTLILNNAKPAHWAGRAQVVDLRGYYAQAPRSDPERRRLSRDGLELLRAAFSRLRAGPTARPVPLDSFRFNHIQAIHKAAEVGRQGHRPQDRRAVPLLVGATRRLEEWMSERYGIGPQPTLHYTEGGPDSEVRLDVSGVFPDPEVYEVAADLRRLKWPYTRLACLASAVAYVRSAKAPEREADIAALSSQGIQLIVPVEPHADALASETPELAPPNRCFFVTSEDRRVNLEFVAAWMNSPSGRTARRAALLAVGTAGTSAVRSLSQSHIWRFLDELVVPMPDLPLQQDLASTEAAVAAASRATAAASRGMWQYPSTHLQIRRRVSRIAEPEQLREWCDVLPYPLAGALWLFETLKDQPAASQGQLLRFWEATAEFLSAVLLSALDREPTLREAELPQLSRALDRGKVSLQRATFGTWTVTVQRLTSVFRNQLLSEEPDAAARLRQLFADPGGDVLERLLDPTIGATLSRVNALRNRWYGHAGATSDAQFSKQVADLVVVTEELRNALGGVWEEYQLVRAGKMARRAGRYYVDVELATGRVTPFRKETIPFVEPLDQGRLYLVAVHGEQALPLNELILLRSEPRTQQSTAYFYNRREAGDLCYVSYQYAEEEEVPEQKPDVERLIAAIDQLTP